MDMPSHQAMCEKGQNPSYAPHQTILFDHLVGDREQPIGDLYVQRFGGLQVDHQFVLGWRLHREISRLLTLEDAIDIAGRASENIGDVATI